MLPVLFCMVFDLIVYEFNGTSGVYNLKIALIEGNLEEVIEASSYVVTFHSFAFYMIALITSEYLNIRDENRSKVE